MYHLPKTGGRFIEDGRNPSLKNFYYFARGVKFDNQDYTAKCVFVKNDWSFSYGSNPQKINVNPVGTIFEVKNDSEGQNNIKINIPYATTYRIRFNQSKMLCVVETVN